jgi:exopolysaccharide production protein ExoZ
VKEANRLNSVHFLRFIAATSVVIHHATTGLGNKTVSVGAAGVDVFFVISGIVIGLSLLKLESPREFAIKRILRVIPMYWLATLAYAWFRHATWGEPEPLDAVIRSLFLFPHFTTTWVLIYFPAWTLTFEALFYIVATASLTVWRKYAFAICLIVFTVVGLSRIPVPGAPTGMIFSTGICLEFCAGMLIALIVDKAVVAPRLLGGVAIVVALGLLWRYQGAVMIIQETPAHFHLARPLELGIPSALLLLGALTFDRCAWLQSKFVQIGGAASYSIYITHVITINALDDRLVRFGFDSRNHPALMSCVFVLAAIAVGVAIHLIIEVPMLRMLRNLLLPRRRPNTATA